MTRDNAVTARNTDEAEPTDYPTQGLHVLLGVTSSSYQAVAVGDVDTLAAQAGLLRSARDSLQTGINNTDILLDMLKSVGL